LRARTLINAVILCISISVPVSSHPIPDKPGAAGLTRLAGRRKDRPRSNRAARLKLRFGLFDMRSKKLYRAAAPREAPKLAARMGKTVNGRKLSGTGKMTLAKVASNTLAAVEPKPAKSPASNKDPKGRGLYPFFKEIALSIRFVTELSYPGRTRPINPCAAWNRP
jgi:hypothetical protein